jgi:hypothetical protein
MKAVVICPDRRPEVAFLTRSMPLALVPVLGASVLSHWLTHLAERGVKEVTLLASDRPDQVRTAMGKGERWGVTLEILSESREFSVAEARARFSCSHTYLADRLPELEEAPLFENYGGFFSALLRWVPQAKKNQVGVREISPGVWTGLRCRIDPTAKLIAPCWLGDNVWVRAGATVGPGAFIEGSAMVDHDAEVTQSWVGPWTYVGALTHVNNSFGWADGLLNHANGSFTEIVDAFLLCDLRGHQAFALGSPWYGRLAALLVGLISSPVVMVAALMNAGSGQPLFVRKRAVVPTAVGANTTQREKVYSELNGLRGLARRWPQLWGIVRGEFTWVGNRPLTREQANQLETEFEQLWLAAPVGLFSLADTFGRGDSIDDEARAHASFYAVRASRQLDRTVLRRLLLRF